MANQTQNLGLTQWTLTDQVKMDEFNNDNKQLEDKLGHLVRYDIMDITVSADAQQVDVTTTGIDWGSYFYVCMDFNMQMVNSASTYDIFVRPNAVTSGSYSYYFNGTQLTSNSNAVFFGKHSVSHRIRFNCLYDATRIIDTCGFSDRGSVWGLNNSIKYQALQKLALSSANATDKLKAGGTIKIWGVK